MPMVEIPPLNALRSFECAARCNGFVHAGKELGVSSAAVSLQVKNLETFLGKELFLRQGNRISLTDAGEAIYPEVAQALNQLTSTTQFFQSNKRGKEFVISVSPSLSDLWLIPKLGLIRDVIDEPLEIRVEPDPVNLAKSDVDLRLTYGSRHYKDELKRELFRDIAVPACSEEFFSRFKHPGLSLENIPGQYFIHYKWGPSFGSEPTWDKWFEKNGKFFSTRRDRELIFNNTSLAIAAARHGLGLVLAPKRLIAEDLEKGYLIVPSPKGIQMHYSYFAISLHAKGVSARVQKMLKAISE